MNPDHPTNADATLDLAAECETVARYLSQMTALCSQTQSFQCGGCTGDRLCTCKIQVIDLLTEMLNYMFRHFAEEEALFDVHLPHTLAESHRISHAQITRTLGESIRLCWDSTACRNHDEELRPILERHLKDHDSILQEALSRRTATQAG